MFNDQAGSQVKYDSEDKLEQDDVDNSGNNFKWSQDAFLAVYFNNKKLYKLSNSEIRFLLCTGPYIKLTKNEVDFSTYVRRQIAQKMNLRERSFDNLFSKITKAGVIVRVKDTRYMINPWIMYCGKKTSVQACRAKFDKL